jgi:hypothetical protein
MAGGDGLRRDPALTVASPPGEGVPADLARPRPERWTRIEVPPGWRAVAAIAQDVAADLDHLADHILTCIQREIPAYAPGAVATEDLHASVVSNLEFILVGVAEHRGPTASEVAVRRELGARRALQGLPVDAVIQAFHVGYRELWLALVRALPTDEPAATQQLLTAATTVWRWVHEVTDAIAAAHAATTRQLEARVIGARQRLVELLVAGDLDGEEIGRLARSLGFDALGRFVIVVLAGATADDDAVELQRRLEDAVGQHAVVARGPHVVVVGQEAHPESIVEVARTVVPDASAAVGAAREGLRGARASLVDAELTLEVTPSGTTCRFEDVWLWATLTGSADRLRGVLRTGADVAAAHPHLARAVVAYADHGFSVTEAARRLTVHANTVGYRLDRWSELTGWEPRTFPGLVRSLAAIRLG